MKRLLLLALVLGLTSTAYAQVPKKVLIEEFTNSGCPPCAATDPMVEAFEAENITNVAVLKYHVSWPDPNDPYYVSQKGLNQADLRVFNLYKQNGVPCFFVGGELAAWANYAQVATSLTSKLNEALATTSPFAVTVTHTVSGGNVNGTVTVNAVGDLPAETDLRLAFVVAERWDDYRGTNGRPFHSSIVRQVMPGIGTDGAISAAGALTIAKGETKTFEFTVPVQSSWNLDQLMSVAFIQSASTKEVFQSEWTVPLVKVETSEETVVVPALAGADVVLTNYGTQEVKIKASITDIGKPAAWSTSVQGLEGGVVTLAPDETKTVSLAVSAAPGEAVGSATMNVFLNSVNASGQPISGVGGATNLYFGRDNKTVVVDAGSGITELGSVANALVAKGLTSTGVIDQTTFNSTFTDWSTFDHVYLGAGLSTGLFSDDGSFDRARDYIEAGGKFVYSGYVGPGIFYSAYDQTGDESYLAFWPDAFGIEPTGSYKTYQSGWSAVKGVVNDPIGFNLALSPAQRYRTPMSPVSGANVQSIFYTASDTIGYRGIIGSGKFVYLGFGLEDMNSVNRTKLTDRIIDWFNATGSVKVSEATTTELANYPNPFNPSTTIEFSITEAAPVTLVVKDMMGREVVTLIDYEMHTPGTYQQAFDATNLASGTYIYELTSGSTKLTEKMTLNK